MEHPKRRVRTALAGGLAALMCTVAAGPVVAHKNDPSPDRRARLAIRYLVRHQKADGSLPGFSPLGSTADAVQAMVATRRAPGALQKAIAFIEGPVIDDAALGQKAKALMAVVAAGRDPRDVAGHHDLIEEIESTQQPNGQYAIAEGDFSGAVISHALAMLALTAAGQPPSSEAAQWLVDAQCEDGGWQYDEPSDATDDAHCFDAAQTEPSADFARSDTNTTSLAVQALAVYPVQRQLAADPFTFFETARDEIKGGYVYDPQSKCRGAALPPACMVTDANSTSLVIQAHVAEQRALAGSVLHALEHLQYRTCGEIAGAFAFTWTTQDGKLRREPSAADARKGGASNIGATIEATFGLLRRSQPIAPAEVTKPAPSARPC